MNFTSKSSCLQSAAETPEMAMVAIQDAGEPGKAVSASLDGSGGVAGADLGILRNSLPFEARAARWDRLKAARRLLPDHRVAACMWSQIAFVVELWKSDQAKPSYFRNVATCGSVWVCPMCAAKITERRREELQSAVSEAKSRGWTVFMMTFTLQHKKWDDIADVLRMLLSALSKLKGRKWWTRIADQYSLVGSVSALEVMWSFENGAHVHKHVMQVSRLDLKKNDLKLLRDEVAEMWQKILSGMGGYADFKIGVDVKMGDDYISEYIAKYGRDPKHESDRWGISAEMSKFPMKGKGAKNGHYTMFQMLDLFVGGNGEAGEVFKNYARCFRGRQQLIWSRGLKKELGVIQEDMTDAEIAKMSEPESSVYALFQKSDWKKVRLIPLQVLVASEGLQFEAFKSLMSENGITAENPVFEIWRDDE